MRDEEKMRDLDFFTLNKIRLRNYFIAIFKYLMNFYSVERVRLFSDKHSYKT